jgi:hypothetical protein
MHYRGTFDITKCLKRICDRVPTSVTRALALGQYFLLNFFVSETYSELAATPPEMCRVTGSNKFFRGDFY